MSILPKSEDRTGEAGDIMRYWRQQKRISQMELALNIGISSKHLSFVENGKSKPSRHLILKIAESLNLPLRQRNAILTAAGYASEFNQLPLDAAEMRVIDQALRQILLKHEPYPALVVNASYDILMSNTGFDRVIQWCIGHDAISKHRNIYRLLFSEDGLRPYIKDWSLMQPLLLKRLFLEAISNQNKDLMALHQELSALKISKTPENFQLDHELPVISITFQKDGQKLSFFSTITTFGTPLDITIQELRIELLFPTDQETQEFLRNELKLSET